MDDENIAILTLPYNNDLSSIYSKSNNWVALIAISFEIVLMVSRVSVSL